MPDHHIAVLIDFENVGLTHIRWLFDQISDMGRIVIRRAYADWSKAGSKRDDLLELGIEPIHLFNSVQSGKNASDLRLAIDAIDLLYQSSVDTFVIVSNDSDFVSVVNRLRAAGKIVVGAGPIGLLTVNVLRQAGAGDITVIEPSAARRSKATELGANLTIDPMGEDVASLFE